MTMFDEEDEEIEIPRNERTLVAVAHEQAALRREDEAAEAIARHSDWKSYQTSNVRSALGLVPCASRLCIKPRGDARR
jgi:hypothetical protein